MNWKIAGGKLPVRKRQRRSSLGGTKRRTRERARSRQQRQSNNVERMAKATKDKSNKLTVDGMAEGVELTEDVPTKTR